MVYPHRSGRRLHRNAGLAQFALSKGQRGEVKGPRRCEADVSPRIVSWASRRNRPHMTASEMGQHSAQSMNDGYPLYAFAFRSGLGRPRRDFTKADLATGNTDFVWVHLD